MKKKNSPKTELLTLPSGKNNGNKYPEKIQCSKNQGHIKWQKCFQGNPTKTQALPRGYDRTKKESLRVIWCCALDAKPRRPQKTDNQLQTSKRSEPKPISSPEPPLRLSSGWSNGRSGRIQNWNQKNNPGSSLIAPAWNCLPIWLREVLKGKFLARTLLQFTLCKAVFLSVTFDRCKFSGEGQVF